MDEDFYGILNGNNNLANYSADIATPPTITVGTGVSISETDINPVTGLGATIPEVGGTAGLWIGESITVTDVIACFAGSRTVMVQREGYEEPVHIPACPRAAVEAAIGAAVRPGILWLVNGPASFQGEPVPAGVLTAGAQLRAPMFPLTVHQLAQDALPDAWKDGQTTALALSIALARQSGHPIPWSSCGERAMMRSRRDGSNWRLAAAHGLVMLRVPRQSL